MQSFQYLHKLKIEGCNDVEVVFEIESRRRDQLPLTTTTTINQHPPPLPLLPNLQHLEIRYMDNMSHVWKWNNYLLYDHNQSSFHNLTTIKLSSCPRIKYLFLCPMAKLLSNLKEINIYNCDGMEEVVSNRRDEEITAATSTTTFFPHLHSITFSWMYNLKRIDGAKGTSGAMHDHLKVCFLLLTAICKSKDCSLTSIFKSKDKPKLRKTKSLVQIYHKKSREFQI